MFLCQERPPHLFWQLKIFTISTRTTQSQYVAEGVLGEGYLAPVDVREMLETGSEFCWRSISKCWLKSQQREQAGEAVFSLGTALNRGAGPRRFPRICKIHAVSIVGSTFVSSGATIVDKEVLGERKNLDSVVEKSTGIGERVVSRMSGC